MSKKPRKKNKNLLMIKSVDPAFVNEFVERINELALKSDNSTAIITLHSDSRVWDQTIDVVYDPSRKRCIWGYQEGYQALVLAKLINPESYPLSVVIRTFTSRRFKALNQANKEVLIPGKEIRMFYLPEYGQCLQLSKEDCFACMNTDANTGEVLPLDVTIEYISS